MYLVRRVQPAHPRPAPLPPGPSWKASCFSSRDYARRFLAKLLWEQRACRRSQVLFGGRDRSGSHMCHEKRGNSSLEERGGNTPSLPGFDAPWLKCLSGWLAQELLTFTCTGCPSCRHMAAQPPEEVEVLLTSTLEQTGEPSLQRGSDPRSLGFTPRCPAPDSCFFPRCSLTSQSSWAAKPKAVVPWILTFLWLMGQAR